VLLFTHRGTTHNGEMMDEKKMLSIAMTMREAAADLIDQAEAIELDVKIQRVKSMPNGELMALLIELGHAKKNGGKNV
jgi:hypothetical protein